MLTFSRALALAFVPSLVAGASLFQRDVCNADNVLRALQRADGPASTFCSTYTQTPATSGQPYPTYISAYSTAPARVSSACTCLNNPPAPTCNPGRFQQNVVPNSGFDKLDATKPRNAQATPWVPIQETNAVIQYVPVEKAQSAPNAAFVPLLFSLVTKAFYFYETPSSSDGSATLETTITVCNGFYYGFNFAYRFQYDEARGGYCSASLSADYFSYSVDTFPGDQYVSNTTYFRGVGRNIALTGAPTNAKDQIDSVIVSVGSPV